MLSKINKKVKIFMTINKKIKVGVIFGGRSGEHEVSIVSASSVMKALKKKGYGVVPIGITKNGLWLTKNPIDALKYGDVVEKGTRLLPEELIKKCDVFFPVLHGSFGEDGTVQGLLEMANVPYVGSGVLGSALSMDKVVQKQVCQQAGIPIVKYEWFYDEDFVKDKNKVIKRIEKNLSYPVFVKPANLGSSVGISKCKDKNSLIKGIKEAMRFDHKVIVEEGAKNFYEIEVAVLGNKKPEASVLGEIIPSNDFYDYNAKYVDGKSEEIIGSSLDKKTIKKVQEIAIESFKVLNVLGFARIDFFVLRSSKKVYLNEVNTIPGFTSISMFPKLWEASGVSYEKLVDKLIKLALENYKEKNELSTSYDPKEDWYK